MKHRSLLRLVSVLLLAIGLTIGSSAQDIFTDQDGGEYFFYIPGEEEL